MKTFKQFQEQLERGKVTPAQLPSPEQNRKKVSDSGKSRRSLVKRLMYRTALPYRKRHDKRMEDLLKSPHHAGMHGEDVNFYESSASEYEKGKREYEASIASSEKLAGRRQAAADVDPVQRGKDLESKEKQRVSAQKERAVQAVERQRSTTERPKFRRLLNFDKQQEKD